MLGRRELLARIGLATVTAAVAACSTTDGSETTTPTSSSTTPSPTTIAGATTTTGSSPTTALSSPVRRPNPNAFLSGNYAPIGTEATASELRVVGAIPDALSGHFIRNGPNPIAAPTGSYSWFGGDGMVHIVELDGGRASYRNRWLRTPTVSAALGESPVTGSTPPTLIDVSNTSTARLGGDLLSVTEAAVPYRFDTDGNTLGRTDLDGALTHGLSAHAKYDPTTGEVHQVTYRVGEAPFAVWQVIDRSGQVTSTTPLDLPQSVMIHNATLTPKYVLVYDLPVAFSPDAVAAGWTVPFAWDATHQTRLGVIDRATAAVRWLDIPPQFVFHDAGSHDTDTGLEVDLVTYSTVFDRDLSGPDLARARLQRWSIDLAAGHVDQEVLDDRPQEFPRIAPGSFGRAARYTYTTATGHLTQPALSLPGGGVLEPGNAVLRHDRDTGSTTEWSPGPTRSIGEAVFVADPARTNDEDGGWLLGFVYDAATDSSEFVVLDAADLISGPLAVVALPQRVPMGFHGNWYERR